LYVTCFVPSGRIVVPRSALTALPETVGSPAVVTGGHAFAHAPLHAELVPLSASNK
jgi:hypothetical protein